MTDPLELEMHIRLHACNKNLEPANKCRYADANRMKATLSPRLTVGPQSDAIP